VGGIDLLIAAPLLALSSAAQNLPGGPGARSGEIVVTGERVKRSLRETSSSIAVFDRQDLEATGTNRIEQALPLIPNVQLGSGSQGPAIRGLDTTGALQALPAFLGGNRPRTTLIVDGRSLTYSEFVFGTASAWDVQRIEVYRSPQTTTQGQNSIAGAIFVFSEDPAFEPTTRMRLVAGDYRTGQVSAMATGPLSGDVAVRVAGDLRYSRTTSRIADVMSGADPNHDAFGVLRAKLLLQPRGDPGTRAVLTITHAVSQAPQVVGVSAPFRQRNDVAPNYGVFRVRADTMTTSIRQKVGRGLVANLLLTTGHSSARRFALPGFGETQSSATDWLGEVVLNWNSSGPVSGVAGASRSHLRQRQNIDLTLLSGLNGSFRDWQDGTGLFGEVNIRIVPRTTLTGGVRYQHDRQRRVGALVTDSFSVPADFIGNFSELLPKLSLAYDVSPKIRAGLLVQKAYNPGGTTIRFDTARPDTFAAETLWDVELFGRASIDGGRMLISANIFNYMMRNAQRADPIIIYTPTGRRVGFANLFNVPRARSRGLEASFDWRPNPGLRLRGSVGLLRTRILEAGPDNLAYAGRQFDRSPHYSASAAADWRPVQNLGIAAQVRHHSSYFSDNLDSPQLAVAGATLVDVRASYDLGRVSLFLQARNALNKFAMLMKSTAISGQAEDPRRIAAGLEARF
jgi:outer membrane receptor protein involved in Fe transport